MSIKIYAYAKCSTCKKAQSLLQRKKLDFESVDITQDPPSMAELKAMLVHVAGNMRKLFNTSGQVYREMKISDQLPTLSEAAALKLLAGNGRLIKRPFLVINGKPAAIGFDEKEWSGLV